MTNSDSRVPRIDEGKQIIEGKFSAKQVDTRSRSVYHTLKCSCLCKLYLVAKIDLKVVMWWYLRFLSFVTLNGAFIKVCDKRTV